MIASFPSRESAKGIPSSGDDGNTFRARDSLVHCAEPASCGNAGVASHNDQHRPAEIASRLSQAQDSRPILTT